jgi:molecular chaperone DnaK
LEINCPADKKAPIEEALGKLKEAHKSQDLDAIDKATAELNAVWQTASEEMYKASQAQEGAQPGQESREADSPVQIQKAMMM